MKTKTCRTCGKTQPEEEYYVHSKMADGRLNICKNCVKTRVKLHRKENDSVRMYDRWRYKNTPHRKIKQSIYNERYRQMNPEKYKAHTAVNNAIRDGRLKKLSCNVCGNNKVHAHHNDYSKPLEVIWLCSLHHARKHHE
jgi:hypothetical protein